VKAMINLALQSIFVHTSQVTFTCCKILRYGASSFTFPQKEGVLQVFVTLQSPLPRPDLNPQTLGPLASTLTITEPR
jgi:hypothetical protein